MKKVTRRAGAQTIANIILRMEGENSRNPWVLTALAGAAADGSLRAAERLADNKWAEAVADEMYRRACVRNDFEGVNGVAPQCFEILNESTLECGTRSLVRVRRLGDGQYELTAIQGVEGGDFVPDEEWETHPRRLAIVEARREMEDDEEE